MAEPDNNLHEFSVSELSNVLKRAIEENFSYVRVRGEISGYKRAPSGHVYFNLKDESAVLASVCWKGVAANFSFKPEDGLEVVCEGKLSTYPARSNYQLVVAKMEPAGEGALMALLEERKKKLAAEGLFAPEKKKPLPYIPSVIGVITSPTGAVIRDILHRLSDRFPRHVLVWPVQVQGEASAGQVAAAIEGFNALPDGGPVAKPDLLIVARGGGSLEDLWPFNEEIVVRAAAASEIPLISAVGHETDTTLIDYASDVRAPTPTAAAEIAVPVQSELQFKTAELEQRLNKARVRFLDGLKDHLAGLVRGLPVPKEILGLVSQKFDDLGFRLPRALSAFVQGGALKLEKATRGFSPAAVVHGIRFQEGRLVDFSRRFATAYSSTGEVRLERFKTAGRMLQTLSYQSVLKRGYAVVRDQKSKIVTDAETVKTGAALDIEFRDGHVPVVSRKAEIPAKGKKSGHKKTTSGKKDQGSLF